jgi:hypothetical protein
MGFDVTPEEDDPVFTGSPPPRRLSSVAEQEPRDPGPPSGDPASREEALKSIWERDTAPALVQQPALHPDDVEGQGSRQLGIPESRRTGPYVLAAIGAAVAGVALAFLFFSLVGGPSSRTAPDDAATVPVSGSPPAAGVIGEPLRVGPLAFLVHGIREVPATPEERPAPGMRWVAVDVEVVNEGQDQAAISSFEMFDLTDSAGGSYGPTVIGSVAHNAEGNLAPGLRLRGEVVFEVPQDAGGFLLLITTPDRSRSGRVDLS